MLPTLFPTTPDREIVSSRILPFQQALVFRAWTEPEHLQHWWGPAGFTNTFHEHDLRPGGHWRFTMHGPDRGHFENHCEFTHIDPPQRLAWLRHSQPWFRVVATFDDLGNNQTRVVFRMVFDTEEGCEKIRRFAVDKNEENFDRLESELLNMSGTA